ncbi:MAG: secondary thiamine-phosphate synthase enzyme YjbQ [Gammaproteobacteria bacterium]|nr:secondary thiamine-phosphate synthase enzyme YjbQ [Gammaproteobacteria bacterium]
MWWQTNILTPTRGRGFYPLTDAVAAAVAEAGIAAGLCHLFLRHTSASLCITENADPQVHADLERFAQRLAPDGDPLFGHDDEGPDDMPGHVRNLFAGYQVTVPVGGARLLLGTWQGIYLWEHRNGTHRREVVVTLQGQTRADRAPD